MKSRLRRLCGRLLLAVFALNVFDGVVPTATTARAQDRVIVVSAEQPNVWTLEQAHYLLAQMHRRNLDLKAKSLEELDPNEINGLRFDVIKTLIELGATFNQADLETNRLLSANRTFNAERRQTLISRRDRLRDESLELGRQIADLQGQKARATTDAEKTRLDAEVAARTTLRAGVDKQVEQTEAELGTITAPSGDPRATEGGAEFKPDRLPKGVLDDVFKEAVTSRVKDFNEKTPRPNASLQLENFLQMQLEIIAKQLTLLRDEVGPGERLLFLELPQTVNVAHHESNRKWAQSWWRIAGYTVRCPDAEAAKYLDVPEKCKPEQGATPQAAPPPSTEVWKRERAVTQSRRTAQEGSEQKGQPAPANSGGGSTSQNQKPIKTTQDVTSLLRNQPVTVGDDPKRERGMPPQVAYKNKFVSLDDVKLEMMEEGLRAYLREKKYTDDRVPLSNRAVRTVDLIPRQSSLNVNDLKLRTKAGAFNFVLSTLFGFGARLNVQRQREQFSQFVQQELYSAAFGKGAREFGWTFTPMPGTDRLLSGVRTTYAAVVVPEEATSLVVESNGCYFPRSQYQPNDFDDTRSSRWNDPDRTSRNCNSGKVFVVSIPSASLDGSNDFWVEGVSYQPVAKGKRVVVLVSGSNFSSQIGVLVNGVPLAHSIGLAQPLIRDDSKAFKAAHDELKGEKVRGRVERVDTNKIVFSFEVDDFEGTPTITLVAPGKAIDLNWLDNVTINGKPRATLDWSRTDECNATPQPPNCLAVADWMFGERPKTRKFRIDSVEVFRVRGGNMKALIHGAGFKAEQTPQRPAPPPPSPQKLFINGVEQSFTPVSPALIEVRSFPAVSDPTIQVTLVYGDDTVKSQQVFNPAHLRVGRVVFLSYDERIGDAPGVLVVKLEGSGFTDDLTASPGELVVRSPTEAILTLRDPAPATTVTLSDATTGRQVRFVAPRRPLE
jgi:hypothetical protein